MCEAKPSPENKKDNTTRFPLLHSKFCGKKEKSAEHTHTHQLLLWCNKRGTYTQEKSKGKLWWATK